MSAHPSSIAGTPSNALRIAVLEDDIELRETILLPGLRDFGFDVCGAGSADELYRHMLGRRFDMVVLDIGLPHEDGFSVAQRLRGSSSVGIVMLTGHTTSADRIRGLSESADAYLSKPVVLAELAATLHSLARRLRPAASGPAPGQWRLDTDGWCLRSPADHSIALTQAERCILTLLMASPGTPVKRETLIATLTDNAYDFDPHRLEMLVHRLRGKIADGSGEALPLRAVRGTGYVMLR
ncbi:response regulator transcription factor [Rhodanobacter umsongensis]|uniref:Response regulator transcription factor n=1 Tax=Rhodanobacter umsongensis TaxID=633153 RepID=A0ABW0JIM7_9GAMM